MKRLELWKLIPPSVDHMDEVLSAAGYADGGIVEVEFRVGERHYVLWTQAPPLREKPLQHRALVCPRSALEPLALKR